MSLTADVSAYNHFDPTSDSPTAGRWVACDESGWDGEQLLGRGRYFVYAAVAIDDSEAGGIIEGLRTEIRAQAPELKFGAFKNSRARREALRRLWGEGGPLEGRCWAFIFDKEYLAVAKVIDLLLEEQAFNAGIDLHIDHRAKEMARTLALHGRRALGEEGFNRLMSAFVAFASHRGRGNDQARKEFLARVEDAWASSTRRNITDILLMLRSTRPEAMKLHDSAGSHPQLELLLSSVAQAARWWGKRLGRVSVLIDEQKALTDDGLADIAQVVRKGWGATPSTRQRPVDLRALVRGTSANHPSIQLADLLAGAVRVAAENRAGLVPSEAGQELWPAVIPFLDGASADPVVR